MYTVMNRVYTVMNCMLTVVNPYVCSNKQCVYHNEPCVYSYEVAAMLVVVDKVGLVSTYVPENSSVQYRYSVFRVNLQTGRFSSWFPI